MTDLALATNDFAAAVQSALDSVKASSARVYLSTYKYWVDWCRTNGISPIDINDANVKLYLTDRQVTRATRQRELSALRTLAQCLADDWRRPEREVNYKKVKRLAVPDDGAIESDREGRALRTEEVWRALSVWDGDKPIPMRNKAILAILFYTGMRRSELVALRWKNVDWRARTIYIERGKRDKSRYVTVFSSEGQTRKELPTGLQILMSWKDLQENIAYQEREFIFCSIDRAGRLGEDKPLSARSINMILEHTEELSGIHVTPHDCRRTLATDHLSHATPIQDVRKQLGHARESTTLRYGIPLDAEERGKFRTSY